MAKEPITLAHVLDPNLHRADLPITIDDIRYVDGIPPEVVKVAEEVAEVILEPLYFYGVQVTFFKLWVILGLSTVSLYAMLQGNKGASARDPFDEQIFTVVVLIAPSVILSLVVAIILEANGILVPTP